MNELVLNLLTVCLIMSFSPIHTSLLSGGHRASPFSSHCLMLSSFRSASPASHPAINNNNNPIRPCFRLVIVHHACLTCRLKGLVQAPPRPAHPNPDASRRIQPRNRGPPPAFFHLYLDLEEGVSARRASRSSISASVATLSMLVCLM
jgi:hypothetical protein